MKRKATKQKAGTGNRERGTGQERTAGAEGLAIAAGTWAQTVLLHANKAAVQEALDQRSVEDLGALRACRAEAKGDWRRAKISKRIRELEAIQAEAAPPMTGAEAGAEVPEEATRQRAETPAGTGTGCPTATPPSPRGPPRWRGSPSPVQLWPPVAQTNQRIELKAILAIEEDHRPGRSKQQLDVMVASLKQHGQQVPICVSVAPRGYRIVDGETRRLAAVRLGWTEVLADVYPPMSEAAMHALRAVLNLDRLGTTPVDECLTVLSVLKAITGKKEFGQGMTAEGSVSVLPPEVAAVAAALGRSERWVRDRLVLARLAPVVRELVAAGRLPLGHAREIAKLADFARQQDLAEMFSLDDDGSGRVSNLEDCRRAVENARRAIRGTRWDPSVAYAGRPSCVECPHNTGAVNRLFADAENIEAGCCMNAGCFSTKTAAAEKDLEKAVKAAVKAKAPATVAGVRPFVPDGLKAAAVARQVEKQTGTGNGEQGTRKGGRGAVPERKQTPEEKLHEVRGNWSDRPCNQIVQGMRKVFGKDRKKWAAWNLVCRLPEIDKLSTYRIVNPEKQVDVWRAARTILGPIIQGKADLAALAARAMGGVDGEVFWAIQNWSEVALTEFAGLVGVKAAEPPTLKDFTAENAEDAEEKGGEKKRKGNKPKEANAADADCDHDCETCKVKECESRD